MICIDFHMLIRKAKKSDIPQMVVLLEELFQIERDFVIDANRHAQGLELLLQQKGTYAWILEMADYEQAVGMITLQPHFSSAFGCIDGVLEDFVIHQPLRGRGLGTHLFQHAVQEAKLLGYTRLRLLADLSNTKALDFYRNAGWNQGNMINFFKQI